MKTILIPFRRFANNKCEVGTTHVAGGTERFIGLLKEHYKSAKIHVCEYDDDDVKDRNVAQIVGKRANDIGADVILGNIASSSLAHSLQRYTDVPIIVLIHVLSDSQSAYAFLDKSVPQFIANGGTIAMVSQYQKDNWDDFAKRRGVDPAPVSAIIRPAFISDNDSPLVPLSDKSYDICTIGRSDKYKDPFSLHRRLVKSKVPDVTSCVMTSRWAAEKEYLEEQERIYTGANTTTLFDLPHADNIANLAKSRVYLSTCKVETFGITALEAYSQGVPLMLYCDGSLTHASQSIISDPRFYRTLRKADTAEHFMKMYNELASIPDSERAELREIALRENSKENFIRSLDKLFEIAYAKADECKHPTLFV